MVMAIARHRMRRYHEVCVRLLLFESGELMRASRRAAIRMQRRGQAGWGSSGYRSRSRSSAPATGTNTRVRQDTISVTQPRRFRNGRSVSIGLSTSIRSAPIGRRRTRRRPLARLNGAPGQRLVDFGGAGHRRRGNRADDRRGNRPRPVWLSQLRALPFVVDAGARYPHQRRQGPQRPPGDDPPTKQQGRKLSTRRHPNEIASNRSPKVQCAA